MKNMTTKILGMGAVFCAMVLSNQVLPAGPATLNGAGATFPYPLYSQWAYQYNQLTGIKLNYQSIGSGGGIAQIKARTVDFGASDAPLKPEELKAAGLTQFPMIIGGVVPVINLKDVKPGQLRLSGPLLADIFLGKVAKWNDPEITKLNPGVKLPDTAITVVHRADGSGTTWIFTNYLDKVSPEWHSKVGTDKAVAWPAGVGGKGNEGVAAYVQQIGGAIGYVEFAYAEENQIAYVQLQNQAQKFVMPTIEAFQAAAANADWEKAPGYYLVLTDQPGEKTWAISGASFILVYKDQANPDQAKEMLKFFDWCYQHGADTAKKLNYVPIPQKVYELVEKTWTNEVKSSDKPLWP